MGSWVDTLVPNTDLIFLGGLSLLGNRVKVFGPTPPYLQEPSLDPAAKLGCSVPAACAGSEGSRQAGSSLFSSISFFSGNQAKPGLWQRGGSLGATSQPASASQVRGPSCNIHVGTVSAPCQRRLPIRTVGWLAGAAEGLARPLFNAAKTLLCLERSSAGVPIPARSRPARGAQPGMATPP